MPPRWTRRSRSLDALLPVLYLRGFSTGDFQDALAAMLGADAPNLSPGVISRLTGEWEADYARWEHRDLSARRYAYIWADGVYLQARMEPQVECMLVVIVGMRESSQSWRELLVDIEARDLASAPEIAVAVLCPAFSTDRSLRTAARRSLPRCSTAAEKNALGQILYGNAKTGTPTERRYSSRRS